MDTTDGARSLGYRIDRTLDKLVPDSTEAATVRRIFNLYTNDRLGTQAIATLLDNEGSRTRTGRPWSQHTVEIILTNRVSLGEKRFRDIVVELKDWCKQLRASKARLEFELDGLIEPAPQATGRRPVLARPRPSTAGYARFPVTRGVGW